MDFYFILLQKGSGVPHLSQVCANTAASTQLPEVRAQREDNQTINSVVGLNRKLP